MLNMDFGLTSATVFGSPLQQSIEIGGWTFERTGTGVASMTSQQTFQGRPTLYIGSDIQSTAWAGSGSFRITYPYTITWWILPSQDHYNGFVIYDGVDASGSATDIRIYFHDDRGDRSAREGWQGFLWVSDSRGIFSVASVDRGRWVKISIQRISDSLVNLLVNDQVIGQFGSRSRNAVARIGRLGDLQPSWHRGQAYWSPMTVSATTATASGEPSIPTDLSVSQNGISIQPGVEVSEGQEVKISALISNSGSITENTRFVITVRETGIGLFDGQITVPGRGSRTVETFWTAPYSGNYSILVAVNPFQSIQETDYTNNTATKVLTVSPPGSSASATGIEHTSAEISFNPVSPIAGDTVSISAGVTNTTSTAKGVNVYFWCLYPGATTRRLIAFTQLMTIPPRAQIQPTAQWTVPNLEQVEIQTEVHHQGEIVARGVRNLPIGLPDLGLGPSDITFRPDTPYAYEITPVIVDATIHNYGAKQEQIWAVFTLDGTKEIGRRLAAVPANGTSVVSAQAGLLSIGRHSLSVELTSAYPGATATREATFDNNHASRSITVQSAPDPSIVRLSVIPTNPEAGQPVAIECEVGNAGGTNTRFDLQIIARSREGGDILIGNYTIGPLAPGPPPTHIIRTSWQSVPYKHQIIARIDPQNTAVEKSKENNTATREITVSFDATNIIDSGTTHADRSGDNLSLRENDITRVWTYAKADGVVGPREKYSNLTAADFKTISVPGPQGETCTGDLTVNVWYTGTIDRLTSGVSPIGGEMGDYFARITVGVRPDRSQFDPEDGIYFCPWESKTDLLGEAIMTIGKVILGAAFSSGIGECWGIAAGAAFDVGYSLVSTGRDVTSCDDEVRKIETITFRNVPFIGGQKYQVYIALNSVTKAVAVGLGVGYSEVDFYNRRPSNCDSDGSQLRNRGIQIRDVKLILH